MARSRDRESASTQTAQFMQGERHGYGEVVYAKTAEWYKGEWCLNVRQGQGTLFDKHKNTYTVSLRIE